MFDVISLAFYIMNRFFVKDFVPQIREVVHQKLVLKHHILNVMVAGPFGLFGFHAFLDITSNDAPDFDSGVNWLGDTTIVSHAKIPRTAAVRFDGTLYDVFLWRDKASQTQRLSSLIFLLRSCSRLNIESCSLSLISINVWINQCIFLLTKYKNKEIT